MWTSITIAVTKSNSNKSHKGVVIHADDIPLAAETVSKKPFRLFESHWFQCIHMRISIRKREKKGISFS